METERSGYHLELARQLMITCHQMYFTMPTGLSAELVYFGQNHGDSDIMVKVCCAAAACDVLTFSGSIPKL